MMINSLCTRQVYIIKVKKKDILDITITSKVIGRFLRSAPTQWECTLTLSINLVIITLTQVVTRLWHKPGLVRFQVFYTHDSLFVTGNTYCVNCSTKLSLVGDKNNYGDQITNQNLQLMVNLLLIYLWVIIISFFLVAD